MGEMVASRSMQMLLHLAEKYKYAIGLVEDEVNELVLLLGKIEKLLINDGNSRKVTENIRKIRNLVYTIEDALETLAVKVEEVEFMASKNEKKRGITRLLRKHFSRGDEGSRIILVMIMFVVKSIFEGLPMIKWLHDTFPEVLESEGTHAVLDQSLAHRKSLQRPRLMYTHDMEDHFVEMKDDLEKLVELVADQDKHQVVSIYGVKGLGKTNLARRVYTHPKVRNHFNAFASVSLNQDYQIEDLLQNILNQLDAGALKKSAEEKLKVSEEKKGNLLHGMKKPEAMKKSAQEREKGVEKKIEGAQEQEKGVEEKKEGAEDKGGLFTNLMRIGAGKKSALEHKKGAEETKEGVDEMKEGAQEQEKGVDEKKEGAHEQEKGVEEKKRGVEEKKEGAEEKGSLFTNIMRIGAGKKSATEQKKGVEEKKVGVDETKEGAQEHEKGVEEKKGGAEGKKADVDETKEGAQEQEKGVEENKRGVEEKKEGADEKRSLFTNIIRIGAGKKSAAKHKKGVEEKKVGVDETKVGAQEQEKGEEEKKAGVDETKEGAQEEQDKGVEEKKRGAEEKGSLFTNIRRIGAGKKSAAEHKKGVEEKKEGVDETKEGAQEHEKGVEEKKGGVEEKKTGDETKEGAQEQEKGVEEKKRGVEEKKEGAEEKGSLFTNIMRIGAGKKCAAEHKKGAEENKECVDEMTQVVEEQSKSSEKTVKDQLKEILRNQRCFIVIDDVLEYSQWEYIESEFIIKGGDTKFLLITENKEIAADVGLPHELRCLNDDEGWELLQKYAFHGKKAPDLGVMPKLGKEMVQQCGGLPSKISRLGRTLSKMSSLSEWHKVNDDVAGYLQGKAEQSEWNERHDEQSDPISYDGLPYGEKQCFLYLGMFKEDEGVDPEDLSFLWMAEGMVSTDHQLEKTTTEYYLQELASMLHVQVDELSTNMRLSLRKDLREWSLHLGEKEDFRLKVVDFSGGKQPRFDRYTLSDGTRRLVIHFNKLSSPVDPDLNATENLRSLLFLNSDWEYVNIPVKISDFSEFILLRVLHFVRCKFEGRKLPEGIWKLLNLRYLGVLYCDLDKLPTSIANFGNLQVLNVRSYDDSKIVIPSVISQMKSLKHVRLPSNLDHEQRPGVKLKLDGLLDLETLDGFNDDIHDLDSLSKLEKLRHLSTRADSNASLESIIKFVKSHGAQIQTNLVIEHKCDLTSPEAMTVLEEVLMCPNLNALTFSMVVLPMFPNCGKFASEQLTQIKLIGCKLREDPMEALGKFPDLRKLCLGYGAFIGTKMDIRDGGFPSLEYLEFRCLPNLEEWNVDKVAMKKLSTLIVRKCPKLKGIPYELASHKTLNKVEIELPPTALCDGCLQIYNRKLKFVKSLNIRKLDPLHSSGAH